MCDRTVKEEEDEEEVVQDNQETVALYGWCGGGIFESKGDWQWDFALLR